MKCEEEVRGRTGMRRKRKGELEGLERLTHLDLTNINLRLSLCNGIPTLPELIESEDVENSVGLGEGLKGAVLRGT